jgi:hypothetical protein
MGTPPVSGLALEAVWAGPDRLRAWCYRLAAPVLSPLYAQRERRVFWLALFTLASSMLLTVLCPLWLLALGPVVLGVPHLLADLRYLVLRQGLHRRRSLWPSVVPLGLLAAGAPAVVGLGAAGLAVAAARARWPRKSLVLAVLGGLGWLALRDEAGFTLVFVHLHNLVALLFWAALRRGSARTTLVTLALALAGSLALLGGWADPLISCFGGWTAPHAATSFDEFIAADAPFDDGRLATHVVLSFAFLQAVHYGVWLRLMPDDLRERLAPRPFKASWQKLREDFGRWPLLVLTALALGIALWGSVDLFAAREGYLRLAGFHGYLELAVGALLLTERQRRR